MFGQTQRLALALYCRLDHLEGMGMTTILGILQDRPSNFRYIQLQILTSLPGADHRRPRSKTVYHPHYPHRPRQRHLRMGSMRGHNLRVHQHLLSHCAQRLLLDPIRSSSWRIRSLLSKGKRKRRKARSASDLVDGVKRMMIPGPVARRPVVEEVKKSIILGDHPGCLYHIARLSLHYCLLASESRPTNCGNKVDLQLMVSYVTRSRVCIVCPCSRDQHRL